MDVDATETLPRWGRALEGPGEDEAVAALVEMSRPLDPRAAEAEVLGELSRRAAGLAGARRASFWALQPDGFLTARPRAHGWDDAALSRLPAVPGDPAGSDPLNRAVHAETAVRIAPSPGSPGGRGGREHLAATGAADALVVPWVCGDTLLGALALHDSVAGTGFPDRSVRIARVAGVAAALVWRRRAAETRLTFEQSRLGTELEDHAATLDALERSKTQLLNLASHELRGPIGVLRGYLAMVADGSFGELPERMRAVVPLLARKVEDMNILVDSMLQAARMEDVGLELALTTVDLDALVADAAATVAPMAERGNRIHVQRSGRDATVVGDRARLAIVVTNLLDNACKYSPEGSPVEVTVRADPADVEVAVRDHGIGIDPTDEPRLFTRFGRIVNRHNSHIAGSGLGLHLCRELARRHGGGVAYAPAAGGGSLFTLRLPRLPATAAQETVEAL